MTISRDAEGIRAAQAGWAARRADRPRTVPDEFVDKSLEWLDGWEGADIFAIMGAAGSAAGGHFETSIDRTANKIRIDWVARSGKTSDRDG